jgi:hypothetical protein
VGVMNNNQLREPVHDLRVPVTLLPSTNPSESKLGPHEFDQLLHQAWLILSSRESEPAQSSRRP